MSEATGSGPAIPIDPRIRARRVEVTRTVGRRRLKVLVAGLSVAAVLAAAVAAVRSPLTDVDRVVLAGATHTTREAVVSATGLDGGPQMVDVDPVRLAGKVRALPWVRTARVERRWPGTVRIEITERHPALAVPAPKGWLLIDGTGRVLERVDELPEGLIPLAGVKASGRAGSQIDGEVGALAALVGDLPADLAPYVKSVAMGPDGIELRSEGRNPVVKLGPAAEIRQKVRAVQAVLAGADLRRVTVIDVRVPSAPVLTRK